MTVLHDREMFGWLFYTTHTETKEMEPYNCEQIPTERCAASKQQTYQSNQE